MEKRQPVRLSAPDLEPEDLEAVAEVLRSGRLACGPRAREFELCLAEYVGTRHAVAVSSGTAALHLIVRALEIGPGDEVLLPSLSFAASANAVLYERATPVFVDVEPETYTICPHDLGRKITPRSKAILVVDLFGHPARWDAIQELADAHGLALIDDSCEALGAEYEGRKIGRFGRAAAFSFYPNKQITTGEGGMLVTDDDELARAARAQSNQGRSAMGSRLVHESLGYNYRMNEMSAALGLSQLRRIETHLERRRRVAAMYTERLRGRPWVRPPALRANVRCGWFSYAVTLADGLDRDRVMAAMQERGVPTRVYFDPLHRQPYLRQGDRSRAQKLPVTESVARRILALPFHDHLTGDEVDRVVRALSEATGRA